MRLSDLIVNSCNAAISLQRKNGSFPPRHNGPHNDEDAPVPNTSHWLMSMLKAYAIETFPQIFPDKDELREFFINRQIKRTFNFKTGMMELNCVDPITLAARLYEVTRLADMEISIKP